MLVAQLVNRAPVHRLAAFALNSRNARHACAGIEEETEVLHDAFHRAFEEAKPCNARIPGLQEFAAALWERRRLIPSNHDPLMHIFTEVRPAAAPAFSKARAGNSC